MNDFSKRLSALEELAKERPVERGELIDFGLVLHRVYGGEYQPCLVRVDKAFADAVELIYGHGHEDN